MRNIHASIGTEFGEESVAILRKWEQLEKKIANFSNHRRFTLRCISQKITPTSLKLKSNIKTSRGKSIIQKAEKQLAEEHVRSINNTLDVCTCRRDTHAWRNLKVRSVIFSSKECCEFIKMVREYRHKTILEKQVKKFEQLYHKTKGGCSNTGGGHSNNQQEHTCKMAPTAVLTPTTNTTTTSNTTSAATTPPVVWRYRMVSS